MKRCAAFAPLLLLFLAFSAPSQTPVNDLAARISEARYKRSTSSTLFQSPRSDIITLQNAAAADGNGTAFDVGSYGGVALQIAGSFTATITFEATIDRSNWIAVKADNLNDRTSATTATAAGLYSVPLSGAVQFRARVSDHSGGTVTVKARGVAGYIGLRQSSGGGGGGSVDSVFGRTGDVVAATNDYTWAQINKTTSSLANITTRSASDLSSGTLAADRGGAGTVNGIMKANGSGVVSAAVSATDYAPATSGGSILKGNGSGGFSNAASGTDYAPATSGSAILKGNGSGGFSAAVADTDYQVPLTFTAGVARVTNAISLDVNNANTWTANQTFGSGIARMTSPRITTSIFDANGNTIIGFTPIASAVTYLDITNAATANPSNVIIRPASTDTNSGLYFKNRGTGSHTFQFSSSANDIWAINGSGTLFGQTNAGGIKFQLVAATPNVRLSSDNSVAFNSGTNLASGSLDTDLRRGAAGVIRVANASTGAGTFSTVAVSPAQITGDQNNYAPGVGWFHRWSSDASRNITGLVAGVDGQIIEIWNVGSQNIVLQNENASSTAANRFAASTGADLTLSANKCAQGRYDSTSARWRVFLCN